MTGTMGPVVQSPVRSISRCCRTGGIRGTAG
jgi:hypothetical protein